MISRFLSLFRRAEQPPLYPDTEDFVGHIADLIRHKNIELAIQQLTTFQTDHPHDKRVLCDAAIEISNAGRVDAAVDILSLLNEHNPGHAPILLNLAVCYSRLDDSDQSIGFAREAYVTEPDSFDAAEYLSDSLFELNEVEESKQVCEDYLFRFPEHGSLWFRLGCCGMHSGDSHEARTAFQRAIELDEDNFCYLANYGASLVGCKDFDKAEKVVLQALEIQPEDGVTICNLAQIYESRGQHKDAYELFLRSTQVDPKYERACEDVARLQEFLEIT